MIQKEDLKKLKIFHETSDDSLAILAGEMDVKEFEPEAVILNEGDVTGSLYLIAEGSVSVEKKLDKEGSKIKVVARLEEEEFFGDMAFLENQPHSATIKAQDKAKIYVLPRTSLDNLFKKDAKVALEQVLTLLSGVSARLRSTTTELVTVFQVARTVALPTDVQTMAQNVLSHLEGGLGEGASAAFYRWNIFNEEYEKVSFIGSKGQELPDQILGSAALMSVCVSSLTSLPGLSSLSDSVDPISFKSGHLIVSRSDLAESKEGLLMYYSEKENFFGSGQKQMMETVSSVLAPALATARDREEEESRKRLEQSRQQGFGL